jgi:hypothetical protein
MDSQYFGSSAVAVPALERTFLDAVLRNEFVAAIVKKMRGSVLPQWYLSGGCLFQTVWNIEHGFEPTAGILDYDLFYFDAADLSPQSERVVGREIAEAFGHLPVSVEVRNQARVHLWYEEEFGAPCRAFARCEDGIDGFLATCCSFGLRTTDSPAFHVYAPHGFDDLFNLVVRPNPARTIESSELSSAYEAKTRRWTHVWPRLKVMSWPIEASRSAQQANAASAHHA